MPAARIAASPAPQGAGVFSGLSPHRGLIGLEGLGAQRILAILEEAQRYRDLLDGPGVASRELEGVTVGNAFFEASTRTRLSFELAEKRLSAVSVSFAALESSVVKGESLLDTLRVVEAMRVDLVVLRHPSAGAAAFAARHLGAGVINAGDGTHEHPTQGLLDLLTLSRAWGGRFEGRRIAIVGDVAHSRVARSAIHGLLALGTRVAVTGPPTLVPRSIEALGVAVAPAVEEALRGADAVMALRLQNERMEQGLLPSVSEYVRVWGIDARRAELLAPGGVVLHPGPMNRGIEIAPEVADSPRSRVLEQVTNGVAVRCAVLKLCAAALPRRRDGRGRP
jgi:aspartate carbamoyltransferase catalytic subunit